MATAKRRPPGAPPGYKVDLPDLAKDDKPIRSGDFLEESGFIAPRREQSPAEEQPAPKPATKRTRAKVSASLPVEEERESATTVALSDEDFELSGKPLRTRLNVRKTTRKNLDVVVRHLERFGGEDDVAPSEVVDALVRAAYNARDQIRGESIRRRGKYGTPQHAAYRQALTESLAQAIADHLNPPETKKRN